MGRIKIKSICIILLITLLSGCGSARSNYEPILPEEYFEIACEYWQSPDVEEDNCMTFSYEGRQYLFYSNASNNIYEEDINECVGCTVRDGEVHEDEMILSLSYSDSMDYLLLYANGVDLMRRPIEVYRAIDTKGKDIKAPGFIESPIKGNPMYHYWEE